MGSYRSLLAFWVGGVSAIAPTTQAGFRTPLPFWNGGTDGVIPVVPVVGGGGGKIKFDRQLELKRALREDEEILDIIIALTMSNIL